MSAINKNNYYVVQFKDLPYDNIEKYVIIPHSWVKTRSPSGTVEVAFPKEDPKKTRKRVEQNQKHRKNWQLYKAIVKYDTSYFFDADFWIYNMRNGQPEIQRFISKVEKKNNNFLDVSKNDAVTANNDDLTTNEDSTTKANNNILLLPIKWYKNIDEEKTFSTSTVNKPEMKHKLAPLDDLIAEMNQEQHDTTDNNMSIVVSNTVEQMVQESSAENESSSIPASQSCQPLMDTHEENMTTVIHSPNEQSQETGVRNNDKLNTIDERTDCQNISTSAAGEHSTTSERKLDFLDVSKNDAVTANNDDLTTNEDATTKANKNILLLPIKWYKNIDVEKPLSISDVNKPEMKIKPLKSDKTELIKKSRKRKMGQDSKIEFLEKKGNITNSVKSADDGSNQSDKSPNRKPIVRGFILQDPTTGRLFLRITNNFAIPKQVNIQDTTANSSSSEQDLPPSECKSASCYTDYLLSDYILPKKSVEKCFPETPTTPDSLASASHILSHQTDPISDCIRSSKRVVRKRTLSTTNQPGEPVPKKQFSDASGNSSDQVIFTKELPVKKLNHPNHDKSSNGSECIPQHVLTTENNFPITTEISIDSYKMVEKSLMNNLNTIIKNTLIDFKDEVSLTVRNALNEYVQIFQNVTRDCNLKIQELKSIREPQTKPAFSSTPADRTVTIANNQRNSNNNNHDKAHKTTKKPRSFILPPDYDPNDTRWTLKYREPGPGIIELLQHSNIYIEVDRLTHCKRVASDCKKFARMLLIEIFSLSALSVCSIIGARCNAFHYHGSYLRPMLDEHAITVLLSYVELYRVEKCWPRMFYTQPIMDSICSKIQEIRSKSGSIIQ